MNVLECTSAHPNKQVATEIRIPTNNNLQWENGKQSQQKNWSFQRSKNKVITFCNTPTQDKQNNISTNENITTNSIFKQKVKHFSFDKKRIINWMVY